jgi:uncharacterized membrane protein
MIKIDSELFPYRLDIKSKEPVELTVKLTNYGIEEKLLSLDIILDTNLCLEKNNLKKSQHKRVGKLKPKESISYQFQIYPFQGAEPGKTYKIKLRVFEHYNDYKHVEDSSIKLIPINTI